MYIYIYTCSEQLFAVHLMNDLLASNFYFEPQIYNVLVFEKLVTCRSHLSANIIKPDTVFPDKHKEC